MTSRRKYLLAGAALASIAVGGAAIARHGHHGFGHHGRGHHGGDMGFMGGPGARLCGRDGAEMADHMLVRIEHRVKPTEQQLPAFNELKVAARSAVEKLKSACPADQQSEPGDRGKSAQRNPIDRLDHAERMAAATLDAIKTVRPAAEKFYATLSDDQKAKASEGWGRRQGGGWWKRQQKDNPDRDGSNSEDGTLPAPPRN